MELILNPESTVDPRERESTFEGKFEAFFCVQ